MIPRPLPCPDRFLHAELFPDGRFGADSNLHNLNLLPGMNYSTTHQGFPGLGSAQELQVTLENPA